MKTKLYCDLFRLTVDHERGGVVGLCRCVGGHAGVVARVRGLQVGEGERAGELVEGVDGHTLLVCARELHAVEKPLETATGWKIIRYGTFERNQFAIIRVCLTKLSSCDLVINAEL